MNRHGIPDRKDGPEIRARFFASRRRAESRDARNSRDLLQTCSKQDGMGPGDSEVRMIFVSLPQTSKHPEP